MRHGLVLDFVNFPSTGTLGQKSNRFLLRGGASAMPAIRFAPEGPLLRSLLLLRSPPPSPPPPPLLLCLPRLCGCRSVSGLMVTA